jgi:hypothetical protein
MGRTTFPSRRWARLIKTFGIVNNKLGIPFLGLLAIALAGCPVPFRVPDPGPDYGLIGDHSADLRTGAFDYTLLEMDGHPVKKERVPFGLDMNARTVAGVGQHTFKVRVELHARYPNAVPREATFVARVNGDTTYFVGTREGTPVLIEYARIPSRQ